MRLSLKTKVSILVALVIATISAITTYLFASAQGHSIEREVIARGTALSYSLSKAAKEGFIQENLDLLDKAYHVVQADDVLLAQVYSSIWTAIDAYPFERLNDPPHPDAVIHFKESNLLFYKKMDNRYDFYSPVKFKPFEKSPPITIGFVRIVLSSAVIAKAIKEAVITNIVVSGIITIFTIMAINILIGRFVIKPVIGLHRSVSMFKNGVMTDLLPVSSSDEIGELFSEFNNMRYSIKDRTDKLIESEKRIRSLFERVEHGIFGLDKDGNIIEANDKFNEIFGGIKNLCTLLMSEEKGRDCLLKALSGRIVQLEEKVMDRNGHELAVLLSIYPEFDSSGNIEGYDGYIIDITEKKRLEERLIRSQKMEAVGTLAGGMAHEFNNLLTSILGYSEIILSMTKEGDPFHKPATIIFEAARRGADFGKKILTITRKEKLETRSININDIVKDSIELLRRSFPKNIEIITNLREDIPHTKADPSQLQQVVINLAVNAKDAMPNGGRLIIETDLVGNEKGDASIYNEKEGFIKLSVSDTGVGIDTVTQRRIFDPFFTTKEMGEGTGLGLYIVHSIINNHSGYINLYSEPSKGTRFSIYLPITKGIDIEEHLDAQDLRGSGTILVIDDESDVRELCRDMLEPLGYSVLLAESGNAGINLFRELKDKISLVILDIIMPGISGREVFQKLKTINPEVKVLLCSGYSQNGFAGIEDLLKLGALEFIQKPFSRQAIAVAIKKAISK